MHTKVTFITAPYRYDNEDMNKVIKDYNNYVSNMVHAEATKQGLLERIQVIDINSFLSKDYYTGHGLHLNKDGKEKLCYIIHKASNNFGKQVYSLSLKKIRMQM